jgi:very-short-patch-repair endonuclease
MQIEKLTPSRAVDNAFLQETIAENDFEQFRSSLLRLLNHADDAVENAESEEHLKNLIKPFLNNTNFGEAYYINTKERQDLAIHNGKTGSSSVGVILEAKRPSNKAEMITAEDINRKAFHEAILYYLRERIENKNEDIKHIIITDVYQWFVFDGQDFERYFYDSKKLKGWYSEWKQGQKVSSKTKFVYEHLSEFVNDLDADIKATQFDIQEFKALLKKDELNRDEQKKLVPLFKFFTPTHLLKLPFASDSNNLNKAFYRELLYIMGLQEYKEKGTHYITRLDEGDRNPASLIENTITQLKSLSVLSQIPNRSEYGETKDEQLFNVAIQLLITWINRILFLKLLEAQLYKYHQEDEKFRFLSHRQIEEYDDLNKLFFQVLAVPNEDRSERIKNNYSHIPYLNSSLFDVAAIERNAVRISELEDGLEMPVYARSKIRNREGERLKGESISALEYLLRFLDAYSFNTEGTAEVQEEAKTLINASVLGRIFEKINGYKDGSFFTPGYITEYMCRETIRRAVVQKFAVALIPGLSPGWKHPQPQSFSLEGEGSRAEARQDEGEYGMSSEEPGTKLPDSVIENARHLRKNATDAEKLLWQLLRNRQLNNAKFRRQHPIKEGIILDFYCNSEKLAIEVDGGYHNSKEQQAADAERTHFLNERGIRVIRFTNEQVLEETEAVLEEIAQILEAASSPKTDTPSPSFPLPRGRGMSAGQGEGDKRLKHPQPQSFSLKGEGSRAEARQDEGVLTFADIHNAIGRDISIREANEIINSVTICDPAVGSGHFLVSALNELLTIKSELGIFCSVDEDGNYRRFREVDISVDNDELRIAVGADPFFEYRVHHEWKENGGIKRTVGSDTQRLQRALFREKNILIENCLFGVDINPNSVNICRLRLWVELLKHAYYREAPSPQTPLPHAGEGLSHPSPAGGGRTEVGGESYQHLEVLPNIDINIKQGNSLVSRFELDADLSSVFSGSEHSVDDYKQAVRNYKHTRDRTEKRRLQQYIKDIKEEYSTKLINNRPINKKLSKARGTLEMMHNADLFGDTKFTKKETKQQEKQVKSLEETKAEEESGVFYNQAFEWRFEFPEVLDEDGVFTGFDAVIGNPPYISHDSIDEEIREYLKQEYEVFEPYSDIYCYFIEKGISIISKGRNLSFITSNSFLRSDYGKPLREYIIRKTNIRELLNFDNTQIFGDATVISCILSLRNDRKQKISAKIVNEEFSKEEEFEGYVNRNSYHYSQNEFDATTWSLSRPEILRIINKINSHPTLEDLNTKIRLGLATGANYAYILDQNKADELINVDNENQEIIKPIIRGRDIKKYCYVFEDRYILLTKNGINVEENYPSVYSYLNSFDAKFKKRGAQGQHWTNLRACSFFDDFKKEKICWIELSDEPRFTLSKEEIYLLNSAYFMLPPDEISSEYLLGILNSKINHFFLSNLANTSGVGTLRMINAYVKQIPIPIKKQKLATKIESLVHQILSAKQDKSEADTSDPEAEIDRLVYALYGLSEEEIGIVEGSV